jgi:hypothetical protein
MLSSVRPFLPDLGDSPGMIRNRLGQRLEQFIAGDRRIDFLSARIDQRLIPLPNQGFFHDEIIERAVASTRSRFPVLVSTVHSPLASRSAGVS